MQIRILYGIAIELNDQRTKQVLQDFVGNNGEVIDCYDSRKLQQIIKVIVLTASKVKSSSANVNNAANNAPQQNSNANVQQEVKQALNEVDDWEW